LKNAYASAVRVLLGSPVIISTSTLNVIKQAMKRYISPTTIMLEQGGQTALKLSSMGTGAMFSPPAPIISSLILPVI